MIDPFSHIHPVIADLIRRGMADARAGHIPFARRAFEQALEIDARCIEALLWLAALAPDGETSLRYLSRALEIDPHEPRAHAGIRWARKRLKSPAPSQQPTLSEQPASLADTRPSPSLTARLSAEPQPNPPVDASPAGQRRGLNWLAAVAIVLLICVAAATSPFLFDAMRGDSVNAAVAQVTLTPLPVAPTSTPTALPTGTPIPTAAATETPTPTDTPLPTETPIPTPTATFYVPPPTAGIPPAGGDPTSRWIDVNLTTQTVTAYEGESPVRFMLASTGLWNTPTVTGQFNIYLRYDSQTMSGPGYYLPGVQWVQYFYQGYALHGTYWHNNFGHPMSHGCVNLSNDDALWLYQWAGYGTLVNVHY